ncbi:hypothetical protein Q8A67_002584 [Cirrhinus molitorella]|uniref:Uncharacterized protein n=1 Tax=Cirrhinus molitorella TaxID=172907 RepID=A0AA88TZH4_9TELE|nr:hypothetical protein Q8A67_002584 [Cirrhinus molitorella]
MPPSQLLHMIAGWGPRPFRAQGEDMPLGMTEEGKGQLGAFKGSSMKERGLTCAAGVGGGQIGVRVYQEARKKVAVFQRYLPRHVIVKAAGREQPLPCTSSLYREAQKQSVATRTPPCRDRDQRRSKVGTSKARSDLRVVLQPKRSSAKRS